MSKRWITGALVALVMMTSLAACASGDTGQTQPTMNPQMPDMDHSQMPGMDHGQMSGSGHDMNPIDPTGAVAVPSATRGGHVLEPTITNGVKEFTLTTSVITWFILPDVSVVAYAYNRQVPGPTLQVNAGDRIRVHVTNALSEPTSVHWHGMILPNAQDGAAEVTQPPIQPGETFTYAFTVPNTPGTFFYHTHSAGDR